jgi:ribosome maturation protein Sdo1
VVLSGLDQSGQFTEPPEQIKKDMEEIKRDSQLPQKEKEQALSEMQEALKTAAPLKFKENVALVKKYQKELEAALPSEPAKQ